MKSAAAACFACVFIMSPRPTELQVAHGADDRAAVSAAVHGLFEAAERKQLDRLESYHDFGPEFTKFDEFGAGREDGPTARAAERRAVAGVKAFRADVQELKVDVLGVAAVATFILAYQADTGSGLAGAKLRSTIVLSKRGGCWKVVHEHYSRLAEGV